jgi:putative (di)nucleoside polyphosphate hydrolase
MTGKSDIPPTDGYRRGVGLMMFNTAGLIFTGRRIDTKIEAWQMPQGGIDPGEAPRDAAFRELREETGTDNAEIIGESAIWRSYDFPAELQAKIWNGRFRGQTQKWYALRFLGQDSEIDINGEEPEFDSWRWSSLDDLPRQIVGFKRELYTELAVEFGDLIRADISSRR